MEVDRLSDMIYNRAGEGGKEVRFLWGLRPGPDSKTGSLRFLRLTLALAPGSCVCHISMIRTHFQIEI
jgi:hypothetical protein